MNEIKGYVTRSVLSTLGLSLYILADTFFIANGVGVLGLAALNIALPIFNLLTGLGLLLGMGGATLFALKGRSGDYFSQLLVIGGIIGLFFYWTRGLFQSRFGVTFRSKWRNCCVYNNVYALYFGDGAIFYLEQFMSSIYSQRSKSAVGNEGDDLFQCFQYHF